ncbi:DUF2497 domain-containing protein [Phyllobacterium sp. YR620]|uniref:PopZ family protein n=1 Tax=Phyllobacterium sp. YR620 TaxID=1881066 RepID=UPI000B8282B7|nr:DUF2497 domain-containing protein [Phyllobacterium sp. YR620]
MAQSSSVAREPSMEEILASIRRIIEESDTTRTDDVPPKAVNTDVASPVARSEPSVSEEPVLPPREGIAIKPPVASARPTFEAPLRRAASPVQAKASDPEIAQAKTMELPAEDAAEQLTASYAAQAEANETLVSAPVLEVPAHLQQPVTEMSIEEARALLPEFEPIADVRPPVAPRVEPAAAPEYLAGPTKEQEDVHSANPDEAVSLNLEQALEPILSAAAEREVSAAFDNLSFAVRNEQRRSFDEIAQEIMRPLLQEWLDNNLPTLVERLVREEIERVARGGRRT